MEENLNGLAGIIFMWVSGIIGVGMLLVTAITYVRREYLPSRERSGKLLEGESEDMVYVSAPDGAAV